MFREDAAAAERRFLVVTIGGSVVALDRRTGALCWEQEVDARGPVTVAVHAGRVLVAGPGRTLVCLDYETGARLWRESTSHDVGAATLLCDGDAVFVARGGVIDCFGLDGQVRWYEPLVGYGSDVASLALPGSSADAPVRSAKPQR